MIFKAISFRNMMFRKMQNLSYKACILCSLLLYYAYKLKIISYKAYTEIFLQSQKLIFFQCNRPVKIRPFLGQNDWRQLYSHFDNQNFFRSADA